jgi:hypothetical protein
LYDGKELGKRLDLRARRTNNMRKLASAFLIFLLLCLGAAGVLYWRYTHQATVYDPQLQPEAEASSPGNAASPSPRAPGGSNTGVGPGGARGTSAEPAGGNDGGGPVLRSGESLEYDVEVATLNSTIATIKIDTREKRDLAGKNVWHLQGFAHTGNPYRMVFELDDEFDSYSEAANLTSVQYEMHLSERGQKINSVQRMLPGSEAAPAGVSAARVLPGTRDPLGLLQYLRFTNWSKTTEVRSPVYDGRKLYDVRAVLVGRGAAVKVAAGSYSANKIEIHVYDNGTEMKDAHFMLYLANDAARTPVLMEAVLPFATARVELTKAK